MEDSSGPQGQLVVKPGRGTKTHCCAACNFPIAVYGRCAPCCHIFCLACAADMATCLICTSPVTKLEPIQRGTTPVFISPATLQGYRNEADFAKHVHGLQEKLGAPQGRQHGMGAPSTWE